MLYVAQVAVCFQINTKLSKAQAQTALFKAPVRTAL